MRAPGRVFAWFSAVQLAVAGAADGLSQSDSPAILAARSAVITKCPHSRFANWTFAVVGLFDRHCSRPRWVVEQEHVNREIEASIVGGTAVIELQGTAAGVIAVSAICDCADGGVAVDRREIEIRDDRSVALEGCEAVFSDGRVMMRASGWPEGAKYTWAVTAGNELLRQAEFFGERAWLHMGDLPGEVVVAVSYGEKFETSAAAECRFQIVPLWFSSDADGDGLLEIDEIRMGTDPRRADTDDDGVPDGEEFDRHSDPTETDTDGDDISDACEIFLMGRNDYWNPAEVNSPKADTDEDLLPDPLEVCAGGQGTDMFNPDSDGDGVWDGCEVMNGTNPSDPRDPPVAGRLDSDGDGVLDANERCTGTLKWDEADTDRDGLLDGQESWCRTRTSPIDPDCDHDGLLDGEEIEFAGDRLLMHTNPFNADTDSDGMPDGWEVRNGLNPRDGRDGAQDPDQDGLAHEHEFANGTKPHDPDTDRDGVSDGDEVARGLDPLHGPR